MGIALAMIVRDEGANIARCLDAAGPLIDQLVIDDTGSVDDTEAIIRLWAHENGKPLALENVPWRNFRDNRTALLDRARPLADWLLMLDADLVIHPPEPLPALEAADSWHGRIDFAHLDYTLPFFVRSAKPWYYEGVAHSYLACHEPFSEAVMPGLNVADYSHTGPEKLERDLVALLAEHAARPTDPRTTFYLAQTYYDLDRIPEAIIFYRLRAEMTEGFDEERYFARYRLGCLLSETVSFAQGARELLTAWEERPGRIEALRALAGAATNVANKTPYPADRLFIGKPSYGLHEIRPVAEVVPLRGTPGAHSHKAACRPDQRRRLTKSFRAARVSAIVVTRGDVELAPVLAPLREHFSDIVVWDNSQREDLGVFGRYAAIREAKHPVVAWVDDDVVFEHWEELLAAYDPDRLVCNMDQAWIEGAEYGDFLAMSGAGSLCPAWLPEKVFARYVQHYPADEDFLLEADFVFGVLAPFTRVDLPYTAREFADGPGRLYTQPWQTEKKWGAIDRCRRVLAEYGPV